MREKQNQKNIFLVKIVNEAVGTQLEKFLDLVFHTTNLKGKIIVEIVEKGGKMKSRAKSFKKE